MTETMGLNTNLPLHASPTQVSAASWPGPPAGWRLDEDGIRAAASGAPDLPAGVRDALAEMIDHAPSAGAVLLSGIPFGALPPTPPSPTAPVDKTLASEFALMTVATALGEPVGYAPEHGGDLVQNIVPTRTAADRQVSTSSKVALMFHTEAAFHPHRPRFLLLACLRGDEQAFTVLSSIHQVLPHLDPATVEVLRQPRFRTAVDESYLHGRANQLGPRMAVLSGDPQRPTMIFDEDLMIGTDEEAESALRALGAATEACQIGISLAAGDLLIVDNHAAVHGRSPYEPRFDGTDRWLQRTFVVDDLAPSAADRRGRVIATQFGF